MRELAEVRNKAFILALVLAPLTTGAPAGAALALMLWLDAADNALGAICFIVSFATVLGAPTYLTFGAVFFWKALQKGTTLWTTAIAANVVSAPAVLVVYLFVEPSWGQALGATFFTIVFGCIAAPIWGAIFGSLYEAFVRSGGRREEIGHVRTGAARAVTSASRDGSIAFAGVGAGPGSAPMIRAHQGRRRGRENFAKMRSDCCESGQGCLIRSVLDAEKL